VFNNSRNKNKEAEIARKRSVSLVAFTLMPNHFHLLVCERKENGISAYMQRVQNAYAKYYNAKYKTSGHVFQGPYNSVHIEDNEQLLHASAYIHRNQREIKEWKNKEYNYLWSSYHDYARDNRWSELLDQEIILKQFSDKLEYISFVKTSGIKQDYQTLGV
jgi:putative transposase